MAQDSVITDEMRKQIGVETKPIVLEIEKEAIRRWAQAIDDPNPLYHDEEYAKKSQHGAIIAPPGFVGNYDYPVRGVSKTARVKSPFWRRFNGGNEYEFIKPVKAGDVLTATSKLVDLHDSQGSPATGRMLIQAVETTYWNQKGEVVVKTRQTSISYEGRTDDKKEG